LASCGPWAPGNAPKGRGRYGITGTPKGDIWFVSLAGPPGFVWDADTLNRYIADRRAS